jgi:hypothetical protein
MFKILNGQRSFPKIAHAIHGWVSANKRKSPDQGRKNRANQDKLGKSKVGRVADCLVFRARRHSQPRNLTTNFIASSIGNRQS